MVDLEESDSGLDVPCGVVIGLASPGRRSRVDGDGRPEHLAGMNERACKSAEADEVPADVRGAAIEQDAGDAFLIWIEARGGCDVLLPESVDLLRGFQRGNLAGASFPEHADLAGTGIEGTEKGGGGKPGKS